VVSVVFPLLGLLLGTSLFVAATGLASTALALQADELGFSPTMTGAVMAAYFAGFVMGTYFCPGVVQRAGHVRAFSAFAATAAAAVLLHPLLAGPPQWALLRFVTGVCVVGLYMVIESWLNEKAANEARGRVFAFYQVIALASLAIGQYLILIHAGDRFTSFLIAGALLSLGLVPIVLTRVKEPTPISTVKLNLRGLWQTSPMSVAGAMVAALANGAFISLGPVFARGMDMGPAEIALFMSFVLLGGVALQWPIGHLSDMWDRRTVTLIAGAAAAGAAALAAWSVTHSQPLFLAAVFIYGGAAFSLYPLCVAHANDNAPPDEFVTVAGGLLLTYGIGAAVGPIVAGPLMQFLGNDAFLFFLVAMQAGLVLFIIARMLARPAPPVEDQEPFVMLARTSQSALDMIAPAEEEPEGEVGAAQDARG
jgi:MFS family permease